jgi:hypothetical protein
MSEFDDIDRLSRECEERENDAIALRAENEQMRFDLVNDGKLMDEHIAKRKAAEADRDRYLAALEKIATTPKTETVFLGENVASITRTITVETIQRYADQVAKGGPA